MSADQWAAVDRYIEELLVPTDRALDAALASGLPALDVAPTQGKLLQLLARLQGAGRILELGTLAGYSTMWLARALPADARPRHPGGATPRARANVERSSRCSRPTRG